MYSGNILADNRIVEECDIGKNDYVTLIYPIAQHKEVDEMIEKIRKESPFEVNNDGNLTSQNNNSQSFEAASRATTSEEWISDDHKSAITLIDVEPDELSCSALLEAIPDVKSLCNIIVNDPMTLPKYLKPLSHQLLEKILENQHAFIDILNTDECGSDDHEIETVETKEHEAIDRLVKKGYGKEMAKKVYRACNCDESGAAELLNYLY